MIKVAKVAYELGRFTGQTSRFALKSPLRFTLSVLFAVLYLLLIWAYLHELDRYNTLFYPPSISIPFLGHPSDWSAEQSIGGLLLMTLIWVGSVKIDMMNSKK